jgi:AcrR family transcriptional regulator
MGRRSTKRLSKAERREQLLDIAMVIVREDGADALTLGRLAERAGVSKPVAYEHFGTREGLLIDLYRRIDAVQVAAVLKALERVPRRLGDVARLVSEAYMSCYADAGPEWHAIAAALKGDERMDAAQQELVDGYIALYTNALAPFSGLSREELRLRCAGIIGAAEAISRDMIRGRTDAASAVASLTALIVNGIEPKPG